MIIDAHVHLSTYTGKGTNLEECYRLLLTEMNQLGVVQAIIIPDNIEHDPKIADLEEALRLTERSSQFYLLGSPKIIYGGSSEVSKYESLITSGKIKGLKLFPGHDPYYPTDERCFPYYRMCQQLKVPVVFHTGENEGHPEVARFNDPKYIVEVAKRYPTLPVVITHYFWPKIDYCYEVTKNSPNIYFELAGTADKEVMEKSGGMEKMKKILEKTIQDRPDQVIFGSDWPLCSIESHIALVQSMQISTAHREYVFSKNAIKLYKLQLTG